MRPTASHAIQTLTEDLLISPAERSMWTKIMKMTANLKLKVTRKTSKALFLQKLRSKGVGVNEVEEYSRKEVRRGGGKEAARERGRKEVVKVLMKEKVRSAKEELEVTKAGLIKKEDYLRRRWGHHTAVMASYRNIVQEEVREEWRRCRDKHKVKVEHLVGKWGRTRRVERLEERRVEVLQGIRHTDRDLRRRAEEQGRGVEVVQEPLVYGDVRPTSEEAAVLSLPPKFTTYAPITEEEMEVEAELTIAKIKWELHARKEREEEDGTGGEWSEEWELRRQEEKEVYAPVSGVLNLRTDR